MAAAPGLADVAELHVRPEFRDPGVNLLADPGGGDDARMPCRPLLGWCRVHGLPHEEGSRGPPKEPPTRPDEPVVAGLARHQCTSTAHRCGSPGAVKPRLGPATRTGASSATTSQLSHELDLPTLRNPSGAKARARRATRLQLTGAVLSECVRCAATTERHACLLARGACALLAGLTTGNSNLGPTGGAKPQSMVGDQVVPSEGSKPLSQVAEPVAGPVCLA